MILLQFATTKPKLKTLLVLLPRLVDGQLPDNIQFSPTRTFYGLENRIYQGDSTGDLVLLIGRSIGWDSVHSSLSLE